MPIVFEESSDFYTIQLERDNEVISGSFLLKSIVLSEKINASSPLLTIHLTDATNELFDESYISPNEIWKFHIGKDDDSMEEYEFELSSSKVGISKNGKGEISISFFIKGWREFMHITHNRSWLGDEYSDVVEELASESEFDPDIEDTEPFENLGENSDENIIYQLGWTNIDLIRWIARRAKSSANGCCGYLFGVKSDGGFFFKTTNELFKEDPVSEFVLAKGTDDPDKQEGMEPIYNLSIDNNYSMNVMNNSTGMNYSWFDYNTKEYSEEDMDISSAGAVKSASNFYVAEDHLDDKKFFHGGRDTKAENIVETMITNAANNINKVSMSTRGNSEIHIGDIVEISTISAIDDDLNENISGKYLVYEVEHQIIFDPKRRSFLTILRLGRSGPDGDVDGLV